MTEAQAVEAIYEAWNAAWPSLHAGMEIVYGNEAASAADTWARVTVTPTTRQQITMGPVGSRRYENRGYIAVQLYTPVDKGDALLRGLCDDARSVLEGIGSSDNVVTFGAVTAHIATDGRWYYATVTVPALWYEQR